MADTELYPRPLPDLTEDDRPDVSLVVPVFNEERTIEQVVSQAIEVLERDSRTFEVIVVDDGSRDGTWATIERLHAGDARVKAVRFKRNFGQHPAMHAGLVRARGDIVVTMDGDLQNQPSDLPKLIGAVANGADVASGRRKGREDSWGRTLPSKLINGMLRRFTVCRHLRLRLCLQRLLPRCAHSRPRRHRQAEVHQGARPRRRRPAPSRSTSTTAPARTARATRRFA